MKIAIIWLGLLTIPLLVLVSKVDPKKRPDQVISYFDYDSWVLLTIRFN